MFYIFDLFDFAIYMLFYVFKKLSNKIVNKTREIVFDNNNCVIINVHWIQYPKIVHESIKGGAV